MSKSSSVITSSGISRVPSRSRILASAPDEYAHIGILLLQLGRLRFLFQIN